MTLPLTTAVCPAAVLDHLELSRGRSGACGGSVHEGTADPSEGGGSTG